MLHSGKGKGYNITNKSSVRRARWKMGLSRKGAMSTRSRRGKVGVRIFG